MSRPILILCLLLFLAAPSALAIKADIQVLQDLPNFISVQENNFEELRLTDYFAGFNLSFSLVPPKISEAATRTPEEIVAYKAVSPITQGKSFNGSRMIGAFAALKQDNTLRIIQVSEDRISHDLLFWDLNLPVKRGIECFDIINPLPNEIWVDCQNTTEPSNVIFRLYFSAPQKYTTLQTIITARNTEVGQISKRSLQVPVDNTNPDIQVVYRFCTSTDGRFSVEEYIYLSEVYEVRTGITKTKADYPSLEGFQAQSLIAFANFSVIVGSTQSVAIGSFSSGDFKKTVLFKDYIEIYGAKVYKLSKNFYFMVVNHQNRLAGFYINSASGIILTPSSVNTTFPPIEADRYLDFTKLGSYIVAIGSKPNSRKSVMTIYNDDDFKELDVYYHAELTHAPNPYDPTWLFPIGETYVLRVSTDLVELFQHSSQVARIDHSIATSLIDNYQLVVKSQYYDQHVTRTFDLEFHYYRENDTSIGVRKDNLKYVNLMYPNSHYIPIWHHAYGPALHFEVRTTFPHVMIKDHNNLTVNFDKARTFQSVLKGSDVTFVEFKAVNHSDEQSDFYFMAQANNTLHIALCGLKHDFNHSNQDLDCANFSKPLRTDGEIVTVNLDHPEFNLVEEYDNYKEIQTLKFYSKDFRTLHKTIVNVGEGGDLTSLCSELTFNIRSQVRGKAIYEYLCIKHHAGIVYRYDTTNLKSGELIETNITAESVDLKSIHHMKTSVFHPSYFFVQSEHKVVVLDQRSLMKLAEYDFSKNFTTTFFEYFVLHDKIVAISYDDQKIIEVFIDMWYKPIEVRSVGLFGYHIDMNHRFWDALNWNGNIFFQGKNAYGDMALLAYDFTFDPNAHPLRAIIPIEEPTKNYGYYLRVAQGAAFSVTLLVDVMQADKFYFKQVHPLPLLFVTTNQTGFSSKNYEKSYEVDLQVTSPLTTQKVDLSFNLYLTVTQRTVANRDHSNVPTLLTRPTANNYCGAFDSHDLFEGTVFDVKITHNPVYKVDFKPRVQSYHPFSQGIESLFLPDIFVPRAIALGRKYLYVVGPENLYQVASDFVLTSDKRVYKLPKNGNWNQAVISPDDEYLVVGAPSYEGTFSVARFRSSEGKTGTVQANDATLAISSDNILFVVSSPQWRNFSSEDVFITCFDLSTMNKLKEFTFASAIDNSALDFNQSNIQGVEVYNRGAYSYDLIILDRYQGLIFSHVELSSNKLTSKTVNVTNYVKRDLPGVAPEWNALKLISAKAEGSNTVFKVVIGARNYHAYLLSITKTPNLDWSVEVIRGFMSYFLYSEAPFIAANEKFFVSLAYLPKSNTQNTTGEYLFFYDLSSSNATINVAWDAYPLVDAFQRVKVATKGDEFSAAMGIAPDQDLVYTLSFFNGDFTLYRVSHNHQICIQDAQRVDSSAEFVVEASNDFSKAVHREAFGKNWETFSPSSGGFFSFLWHLILWCGLIALVGACGLYVIKKIRARKGVVKLRNESIYREL